MIKKERNKIIFIIVSIILVVIGLVFYIVLQNSREVKGELEVTTGAKKVVMTKKKALTNQPFYKKMMETTVFSFIQYDEEASFLFDGETVAKSRYSINEMKDTKDIKHLKVDMTSGMVDGRLSTMNINLVDKKVKLRDWLSNKSFVMDENGHITGGGVKGSFQIRTNGSSGISNQLGGLSDSRLYYVEDGIEKVLYESNNKTELINRDDLMLKTKGRIAVIDQDYMDVFSAFDYMSLLAFYHNNMLLDLDEDEAKEPEAEKAEIVMDDEYKMISEDNQVDFESLDYVHNQILLHKNQEGLFKIKGIVDPKSAYQYNAATEDYILLEPNGIKLVKNPKGVNNEKYTFLNSQYNKLIAYDNVDSDTFTRLIISDRWQEITATINSKMTYTDDDNREETAFITMKTVHFGDALSTGDIKEAFNPNETEEGPYIEVTSTFNELETPAYVFINQDVSGEYTYTINNISYSDEEMEILVLGALIAIDVLYFNESE